MSITPTLRFGDNSRPDTAYMGTARIIKSNTSPMVDWKTDIRMPFFIFGDSWCGHNVSPLPCILKNAASTDNIV